MKGTVTVAGSLAQKPRRGGHSWVLLQYLLGFRKLGWDVLFLDRLEPAMCVNSDGGPCSFEDSLNLKYFLGVMREAGLEGTFALDYNSGEQTVGLSRSSVLEHVRSSDFFLNVMGFVKDDEILSSARTRVFLDIDPGFSHMWKHLGLADLFSGYDKHVSIARNIGRPGCSIPACGLQWITIPQPVVLDYWPSHASSCGSHFTTVASWRGAYGPLEYQGKTYGLRVHEFRKFVKLPRLTGRSFSVALDIREGDRSDQALLAENGWMLLDPLITAGDLWSYRRFIQESRAEIMIAKNMYVESCSGWFSDRSACYLASGRPVLAQDTGLAPHLPVGEGIIPFRTLEEAAAGVESISSGLHRHARAAREIAEEYFDSNKVLSGLVDTLGIN